MSEYLVTPLCVSVHLKNENPVLGEYVTHVMVEDDAAGGYIKLKQYLRLNDSSKDGTVIFDIDELETVFNVAKELIEQYKKVTDGKE